MSWRNRRARAGSDHPAVQRPRRSRLPLVGLGAMAVGVAGLLVLLPSVSSACQPTVSPRSESAVRTASAIATGSDVLIIGDSYSTGVGSSSGRQGWAQDLVSDRRWDATIDAYPGTGYVDTGRPSTSYYSYEARIERMARRMTPDLVIVQGSQNDWLVDAATLQATVERTLRKVQQQWPNATVVALGPSAPYPRSTANSGISASVAAGAEAVDVPYIDALSDGWFTPSNSRRYVSDDGGHLDDAGYQYLADRVSAALDDLASAPSGDEHCA
ncbi:SGNH/GDSL hydrolase family protein [Curtobacterium luteum]|uniref:SGNH/GDSL hydrolase family protein n=1 Tax=Curtobacterium luteum TaxID=33881 RepID=UPI003826A3D0